MPDLGILLTDALALKAHQGAKTVTRRPVVQPERAPDEGKVWRDCICHLIHPLDTPCPSCDSRFGPAIIRGAGTAEVGGRVWVRECWRDFGLTGAGEPWRIEYRAGGHLDLARSPNPSHSGAAMGRWRPSIHMPKWAARTWGRITSVTLCDLSRIDDAEARREGFDTAEECVAAIRALYPTQAMFWRVEWVPMPTLEVSCA